MLFINSNSLPIAKLRFQNVFGSGVDYKLHIINDNSDNIDLISLSISNLIRLGIVDVSYSNSFSDKSHYSKFDNHPLLLEFQAELHSEEVKSQLDILRDSFKFVPDQAIMVKGTISLTPLGKNFIKVCL